MVSTVATFYCRRGRDSIGELGEFPPGPRPATYPVRGGQRVDETVQLFVAQGSHGIDRRGSLGRNGAGARCDSWEFSWGAADETEGGRPADPNRRRVSP